MPVNVSQAESALYRPGFLLTKSTSDTSAKFGVRGIWKSLRLPEQAFGFGLRANLVAPTYIRTAMTASFREEVQAAGMKVGEVSDVVDGVMRLACDETISGRAMCIAGEAKYNFDLGDDAHGFEAGKSLREKMADEVSIGPGAKAYLT